MITPTPEQLEDILAAQRLRDTQTQMACLRLQRTKLMDVGDWLKQEGQRTPPAPIPVVLDAVTLVTAGMLIDVAMRNRRDPEGAALMLLQAIARHTEAGVTTLLRARAEQDAKAKGRDAPVTLSKGE